MGNDITTNTLHPNNLELTSNDITINTLHPHNLQYATPTKIQIFLYALYLHFVLIFVTKLNVCSALLYLCLCQVVTEKTN